MPSAITRIAVAVNPGVRIKDRAAYLKSRHALSTAATLFCRHSDSRMRCEFPSMIRACRCASSGAMPRAMFSAASSSRKELISACSSASLRLRRKNLNPFIRSPSVQRFFTHHQPDGAGHLAPAVRLTRKLLPAHSGEPVKFGLAVVLARAPVGRNPTAIFEPVQGGIKRSLLHFQNVLRGPLDHLGNGVAMRISHDQGPQDHHVERALQHLAVCLTSSSHPQFLHSNFYGRQHTPLGLLWEEPEIGASHLLTSAQATFPGPAPIETNIGEFAEIGNASTANLPADDHPSAFSSLSFVTAHSALNA